MPIPLFFYMVVINMNKKIICTFLLVILLISSPLIPCTKTNASEYNSKASMTLKVIDTEKRYVEISKYKSTNFTRVEIPKQVTVNGKTYTIVSIGKSAFKNHKELKRVVLPSTVKIIRDYAFYGCSLDIIYLPYKLQHLGTKSFAYNTKLKFVQLPRYECYYASSAFLGCNNVYKVYLSGTIRPSNLKGIFPNSNIKTVKFLPYTTSIQPSMFYGYQYLGSVEIPDTVECIMSKAFSNCKKLNKVVIPNSVLYISKDAFKDSPNTVIYCKSGSYALSYAKSNKIKYKLL